jgi:aryl-alcohol dehydrogenase-like predicted oxidoreductase
VEYTTIGGSLRVSRIAMGCEPLGGTDWGTVDVEAASAAVSAAVDAGINFFDTADVYGLGLSEERLSRALGPRRHDVIIATKVGIRWDQVPTGGRALTYRDASAGYLDGAVEASLRRLAIDALPLLYVHWPDPATPLVETMEALARMKSSGKLKHLAVSNFSSDQIRQAHGIATLSAVQLEYNLLNQQAALEIFPTCRELAIPIVAYGPLAQGLLTGKYGASWCFAENDRRHRLPHFAPLQRRAAEQCLAKLAVVAARHGKTVTQTALRWALDGPGVTAVIGGAKSPVQVVENAAATDWSLSLEEHRELSSSTAPVPTHK